MPLFDANVILRYLLNDHPTMSPEARKAVIAGGGTTPEVLAEVVYVLSGLYGMKRQDIAKALIAFIDEVEMADKASVQYAIQLFGVKKLDFVDCLLAGYHHIRGKTVVTFDRKLQSALKKNSLADSTEP